MLQKKTAATVSLSQNRVERQHPHSLVAVPFPGTWNSARKESRSERSIMAETVYVRTLMERPMTTGLLMMWLPMADTF